MSSPKNMLQHLKSDYTERYRPPLKLPRNLTDEFNKVLLSGDAAAIDKFYREVVLPYCYLADLESEQVKKWDKERSVTTGMKGGETDREDIAKLHQEWRDTAVNKRRKNKGISDRQIAEDIAQDQEACYYAHRKDPTQKYSFEHVRKVIRKKIKIKQLFFCNFRFTPSG
jgi:hypothetical protein